MADDLGILLETSERKKSQFKKPPNPSNMEMEDNNHSINHILEATKQGLPFQKVLSVSTRKAEAINECPEQGEEDRVGGLLTGKGLQGTPSIEESEWVSDNLQIASTHWHTSVARAMLHPFCSSLTQWSSPNNSNPSLRRPSALGETLPYSENDVIQITYESTLDDRRDDIPCDCDEFHCMSDADYFGLNDEDDGPQSTLFLMPEDAIYSAGDASDAISEAESETFDKPLHELKADASAEKSPFESPLRSQLCDEGHVKFANTKDPASGVIVRSKLKNRESVGGPEERNASPLLLGDEDDQSPLPSEMKIHIIEDDCGIDLEWAQRSTSGRNTDMSKSHTGSSCSEIRSKSLDSDDDQKPNHSSFSSASESTSVNSDEQKPAIIGQLDVLGMSDTTSAQSFGISEARNDFTLQFEGSIDAGPHIKTFSSPIGHVSAEDQLRKDGDSKESSTSDEDTPFFSSKRQRPNNFCEQSSCKKQNLTISPCPTLHQQINSAADPRKIDQCDVSAYTPRGSKQTEPIKLQYDEKSRFFSKETRKAIAQPGEDEVTTTFSDVNGTYYDVSTQASDDTSSSEIRTRRPSPRNQEQYKATQDFVLTREPEKHPVSLTLSDVTGTPCEISWQSSDELLQGDDQMTSTDEETNREKTQRTIRRKIYKIQATSPLSNGDSHFSDKLVVPANDFEMDHNTDNDHQVEVYIANNRIRIDMADILERHPDTVFSCPTFFDPMSDADSNAESGTPEPDFQRTSDVNVVALSKSYPFTRKAQQPASSVEEDFVSSLVRKVQSYDAQMIASRTKRQLDRTAQTYERFTSVPLSETKDDIPKSYTMSSIIRKLSPTNRSLLTMMSGSSSASISSSGTSASSTTSLPLSTEENLRPRNCEQVRSGKKEEGCSLSGPEHDSHIHENAPLTTEANLRPTNCEQVRSGKKEEECSLSEPEHDSHVHENVLYNADASRPINLASSSETLACHLYEGIYRNDVEGSPNRTDNLAAQNVHRASPSFEAAVFGEPSRHRDESARGAKRKNLTPASQPYQNNESTQTRTSGDKRQAEVDKSHLNTYVLSTTKVQTPSDQKGGLGQDSDDSKCQQQSIRPIPSSPARNLNAASPGLPIGINNHCRSSNNHCSSVAHILSRSEHEKDGLDDSYSVATTFDRAEKLKPSQIISSSPPESGGDGSENSSSHGSSRDIDTDITAPDSILSSQSGHHMEASGFPFRALSNISKSSMESFIDIISVHRESATIVATEDERNRATEVQNCVEYTGSTIYIDKLYSAIWRILNKPRFFRHSVSQHSSLTEPLLPLTADESSHEEDPNSDEHANMEDRVVSQPSVDHTNNDDNLDLAEQGGEESSREVTQHREGHFCQRALRMCCFRLHHLLWSLLGVSIFLGLIIVVSAKALPLL